MTMEQTTKIDLKQLFDFFWRKKPVRNIAILFLGTVVTLYLLLLLVDRVILPVVVHRAETCMVPNLINLSLPQADSILNKAGLNIQLLAEEYDPTQPPGIILSQVPPPHTKVREGRTVKVKVSKEADLVSVPKLKGVTLRQAELLLVHEGLQLGDISWVTSDSFPKDVVISSTPSSGVSVPSGISVNLEVSLGIEPDTVVVPDLVGKNVEESKKILMELGLQIGRIKFKMNDDFLPGTILEQSLPAGERVTRGTEIDLQVSATE